MDANIFGTEVDVVFAGSGVFFLIFLPIVSLCINKNNAVYIYTCMYNMLKGYHKTWYKIFGALSIRKFQNN